MLTCCRMPAWRRCHPSRWASNVDAAPMTPRADLLSAALWGAFGTLVVVASWRLPRLEQMGINPWSAPGLTPGLIGLAIVLAATALALRAWRAQRIPRALRSAPA